jgi:hypothetical protein
LKTKTKTKTKTKEGDKLVRKGDELRVNEYNRSGYTPFYRICWSSGNPQVIEMILEDGRFDLTLSHRHNNWSPIMRAAFSGNLNTIKAILSYYNHRKVSDLNQRSNASYGVFLEGSDAMDLAKHSTIHQDQEVVRSLEKFRLDPKGTALQWRQELNLKGFSSFNF